MNRGGVIGGAPIFVLEGNETYDDFVRQQRAYREKLVTKWAWLLEGTAKMKESMPPLEVGQYEAMAMLFENQQAVHQGILEATKTTDISMPQKYTLPIIRKVFPQLLAFKIAAVQPMPMYSGGVMQIFYQDFLREDATDPTESITVPDSNYSSNEENGVPKRLKMTITSETATAVKDILAATWSTEVAEDARGTLGIDVEGELVSTLAEEILRALDYRVVYEILTGAAAGNTTWHWTNPGAYTDKDHYETLGHAFIDAENDIYGNRYRRADYIVCGRSVASYIRKMQDFKPEPRNRVPSGGRFAMGVELIGRVTGYWDIFETPAAFMNLRGIMGMYPRSQIDTGYIFAPYIPITPMPLVYAEMMPYDDATMPGAYVNTDKWTRNVRTRNAKKMVVPEMFSTLTIAA